MIKWIVTSSILIAVIIALRYILKGRISLRLQYALWGLALVRLLIPFSIGSSSFSVMNKVQRAPVVQDAESIGSVDRIEHMADGSVKGYYPSDFSHDFPTVVAENKTAEEYARMEKVLSFREAFMRIWLCGAAILFVAFAASNGRFASRLRRTRKPLEVKGSMLPVYITAETDTPCLFGLFRPAIYVTPEAAENVTELRHIVEHETTHFRHGDNFWSVLRGVCLVLHWYNPLVWWAAILSRNDAELACDEATINRIGESKRAEYGRTLIGMTCQKPAALLITATTMTGSRSSIKERITLIAKKPKMAAYTLAAVVLTAAVAVGCTFTGAEKPTERAEIFSDGTITITVSEEYAEQLYVDSLYGDERITMIANIYYKPDYAASDVYTAQTCGGWIMSVLSYPDDPTEDISDMESGVGTDYKVRATDGKRVYIEEYPMDGEYHDREHPENTQIYEKILESLQIDYGNLDSYSAPPAASDIEATPEETLALSYLLNENPGSGERIYLANHAPDAPQENDYRVESMVFAGEARLYESVGVAYQVNYSRYGFTYNENMEKTYGWQAYDPFYIVLRRNGYDNTWDDVFGRTYSIDPAKSIEDVILEVAYSLQDIEVSLSFDSYPQLVGPFSAPKFFHEESTSEILEGWEPIYNEGDDWIRYRYNGLTATCYRNAAEGSTAVCNIETTRSDVMTHRGIRVGATRDEVLAAYPDIYDTSYWDYEGDYLWYCDNEGGWGEALLFWFENNQVVKIKLNFILD